MEIRNGTKSDLQAIREIMNEEILYTTSLYDYAPRSMADMRDWFNEKQRTQMPLIVATIKGHTVAYASYNRFRARQAYQYSVEHSIYVHKDFRNEGIGDMLMKRLIELAKQQRYHTMIAGIDSANKGSYDFHLRFGFREVGRIKEVGYKFDRWLDLIFMQLIL